MAIEENLRKIQEARYGREVRDAIHDAIHECYEDGRAGATDLIAREQIAAERTARETAVAGALSAITAEQAARAAAVTAEENARTAAVAAEQAAREAAVANLESIKADKTQLASPFNFKGSCLFAELPTSGNEVNDTYYVTDMTSRYSWNGTAWYQSGMSEADYTDALAAVETAVQNLEDGAPGTITGELKEDIDKLSADVEEIKTKGGISTDAANLLCDILNEALYGTPQAENIATLREMLVPTPPVVSKNIFDYQTMVSDYTNGGYFNSSGIFIPNASQDGNIYFVIPVVGGHDYLGLINGIGSSLIQGNIYSVRCENPNETDPRNCVNTRISAQLAAYPFRNMESAVKTPDENATHILVRITASALEGVGKELSDLMFYDFTENGLITEFEPF